MDFSEALKEIKRGVKLRRRGWNSTNLYVQVQQPDENSKMSLPYIYITTAQDKLVPWVASQTDLLASDWQAVYGVSNAQY